MELEKIREYAQTCYDGANCEYDGENYFTHIKMVYDIVERYESVFNFKEDYVNTLGAAYCHDILEDCKESYNDVSRIAGKDVADITLAVTDVPADNRLMKHLLTMHKTVKDYRAIVLKMADILANATYSKANGSSMYRKYVIEYAYRKPIFQLALSWHKEYLNQKILVEFWNELDEIHNPNI